MRLRSGMGHRIAQKGHAGADMTENNELREHYEAADRTATAHKDQGQPGQITELLGAVATRIAANEGQQAEAFHAMQVRLRELREQADAMAATIDSNQLDALDQLRASLADLISQIGDAEATRADVASRAEQLARDAIAGLEGNDADTLDATWNMRIAEELTRLYESLNAGLPLADIGATPPIRYASGRTGTAATLPGHVPSYAESAPAGWLDERIETIVSHLADSANGTDTSALTHRFDALEARVEEALALMSRGGGEATSLHELELCIAELATQLETANTELARLQQIESQVAALAETLLKGDGAAAIHPSAAIDTNALAQQLAKQLGAMGPAVPAGSAAAAAAGNGDRTGDKLKETIENFIAQQRTDGEHTNLMLSTMQQSMMRLLDRIDALENNRNRFGGGLAAMDAQPAAAPAAEPGRASQPQAAAHPQVAGATAAPAARAAAAVAAAAGQAPPRQPARPPARPQATAEAAADFDDEAAPAQPPRSRADYVAAARRAAARANAQNDAAPRDDRPIDDEFDAAHAAVRRRSATKGVARARMLVVTFAIVAIGLSATKFMLGGSGGSHEATLGATAETSAPIARRSEPAGTRDNAAVAGGATAAGSQNGDPAASVAVEPPAAPASADSSGRAEPTSLQATPPAEDDSQASVSTGHTEKKLPPARIGPLSLRLAAANGDPSAQFEIGSRYAEGKGIKQDFEQARAWYQKSASQGFALSQYRLATFFERGLGVEKDAERARVWYERAARQDNVKAMHNLAVLAASTGKDHKPDYAKAARWFGEAAQRGLADSQFNLAILHANGLGVPEDPKQAYKWFALAAKGGDKEADRRRGAIEKLLQPADVTALDKMVSEWTRKPSPSIANNPIIAGHEWQRRRAER